jgi:hypothetical protein
MDAAGAVGRGATRHRRFRVVAALLGVVVVSFYAWTAGVTTQDTDDLQYYDRLADAFIHGRLDLRPSPPPGLLALPDPYDPGANQVYRDQGFHDLVLYKGRFYTQWGPTPAVVLFAPLRLVGIDVSHAVAAFVFGIGAWLFGCAALAFVRRRWLPRTPPYLLLAGWAVLAAGNLAPFLMRRPLVYEVVIVCGLCFAMGALYFLLSGGFGERLSRWRLALGSLCLGLAAGSRPHLAIGGLAVVVIAWRAWRGGPSQRKVLPALLLPAGACLLALMAYNQARFGSPGSVGGDYQITAINIRTYDLGSVAYIAPGLFYYLLAPPTLAHMTPFTGWYTFLVPRGYPGTAPPGIDDPAAPIGGILLCAPIVLLAAVGLWRRRREPPAHRELRRVIAGIVVCGLGCMVFLAYLIFPLERYAGDFTGLLVFAGLCGWMLLLDRFVGRPRERMAVLGGGAVLAAWTVFAGLLMSAPATIGH